MREYFIFLARCFWPIATKSDSMRELTCCLIIMCLALISLGQATTKKPGGEGGVGQCFELTKKDLKDYTIHNFVSPRSSIIVDNFLGSIITNATKRADQIKFEPYKLRSLDYIRGRRSILSIGEGTSDYIAKMLKC